jgi:hydroxyacyl-ACP dehydratase HTD2-like protein with hotdog domain
MSKSLRISELAVGEPILGRQYACDNVQLMLYNASLWNGHRIHYDQPYATEVESYPGLVVAGPLIGDWLTQCVMEWLGAEGELLRFTYSNRIASYVGETLTSSGRIISIDRDSGDLELELRVHNQNDEVVVPGTARVRLSI